MQGSFGVRVLAFQYTARWFARLLPLDVRYNWKYRSTMGFS
jgi:hypothetical protein